MKVSRKCELGNFYVGEDSWCESCGNIPFEITWSNGNTFYCLDCARYKDEFEEPTDEIIKELRKLENGKLKDLID
jgi:hypothetical protein